jgi:hypothetical protein
LFNFIIDHSFCCFLFSLLSLGFFNFTVVKGLKRQVALKAAEVYVVL